jgi:hypothetical protein
MLPGGHDSYLQTETKADVAQARKVGEQLWQAGLPVLDDLHNSSYGWKPPSGARGDDAQLRRWRTQKYIETLRQLKPGVTMVIMHCTASTEGFRNISDSGDIRKADMLAMLDPEFQDFLTREHFLVSTWKELQERRRRLAEAAPTK